MKPRTLALLMVPFGWLVLGGTAMAASPTRVSASLSPAWSQVQSSPLTGYLNEINQQTAGVLPPITLQSVASGLLHGGGPFAPGALLGAIAKLAAHDILVDTTLLGQLLALGVVAALLELLAHSFDREDVSRFGTAAVYVALAVLALGTFMGAVGLVRDTVSTLVGFMQALLPLLSVLLAGVGAFVTEGLFRPLMVVSINVIAMLVQGIVVPALIASVLLEVIGSVSGFKLSGVATLMRQVGIWVTGASLTLFIGLIAIYGAAGPVADGVALRSGKFLANTFIPVVGKLFSDATEMVFGSTYLLKDAVGIVGMLGVAFVVIIPILKVLALILVFRIAAAVLAPIGSKLIVDALAQFSSSLALLAVALGATGVMFFLSMTIVFSAGRGVWG